MSRFVRSYERIAGAVVPVTLEPNAQVRLLGLATPNDLRLFLHRRAPGRIDVPTYELTARTVVPRIGTSSRWMPL